MSKYILITSDPDLSGPRLSFHNGELDRFQRARSAHEDLGRNAYLARVEGRFVNREEGDPDQEDLEGAKISGYVSGHNNHFCVSCTRFHGSDPF